MNLKLLTISLIIPLAFSALAAKPIDDVKAAYSAGNYADAAAMCRTILKRTPKDGTANYYLGKSLLALGDKDAAIPALKKAEDRGIGDASGLLADLALSEYRTDDAEKHLESWSEAVRKSKKSAPEALNEMTSRLIMLKNMLERVERIEIIDSVTVDSVDFFKHYPLSPEAGRLLPASALPPQYSGQGSRVVYRPQNGREVLWALPDSTGSLSLVSAGILDDGTMETPTVMDGDPGEGGDADFPFLMPDGVTLYFANNGDNSLGGYDIFMTRRNDDGSLMQPQNIGLPYNSTANDYLLAIDEATGLGFWATDRNSPRGKVTVYTFIPAESRNNYSPDDPDIIDRARITSIAPTQTPGKDYQAILDKAANAAQTADNELPAAENFAFSLGDGRIITSLSQLSDAKSVQAMKEWLQIREEINRTNGRLAALRKSAGAMSGSARGEILRLERTLPKLRLNMKNSANRVVRIVRHIR